MAWIAAVDDASQEFLYGGTDDGRYDVEPGLSPDQSRIVLPRPPNLLTERYSGDPSDPIRAATESEQVAHIETRRATAASFAYDESVRLRALISVLAGYHGVLPDQLEAEVKAAIKTLID